MIMPADIFILIHSDRDVTLSKKRYQSKVGIYKLQNRGESLMQNVEQNGRVSYKLLDC